MSAVPDRIPLPGDLDPQETVEWLDALQGVLVQEGPERAHFLLEKLIEMARLAGADLPFSATTPYVNTIPVEQQARIPGDQSVEHASRPRVLPSRADPWPKERAPPACW